MDHERMRHIEARISTRTYDAEPLSDGELAHLRESMQRHGGKGPFGRRVRFALPGSGSVDGAGARPARMGTYGLIAGAQAYLVAAVERGPGAMEDLGFAVEAVVLDATAAGLGSCWIGGVFSRGKAAEAIRPVEGEIVPAVIALGHPATRRSLADRLVANMAKARSRKPHDALFFKHEGGRLAPLGPSGQPMAGILDAVRIGPSASNKQPWRIVRESCAGSGSGSGSGSRIPDTWLFCLEEDRVYNSALGEAKMQDIDMGIAMRHFSDAAGAHGLAVAWDTGPLVSAASEAAAERGWRPIVRARFA